MAKDTRILIIEDNPADAAILAMAWAECKVVEAETFLLEDSKDAIDFLRGEGYPKRPPPHLILLDYKMPTDGGIALTEIKGDPDFLHIPVIVVSGSSDPKTFLEAYRRRANCCFRKPSSLNETMSLVCEIAEHWLVHAIVPVDGV